MGFLSRKKPKPAPVEIHEEHPIVDELQGMEEAVPERYADDIPQDESDWAAGPVSDTSPSAEAEGPASSPPAAEAAESEPSEVGDEAPLKPRRLRSPEEPGMGG